MTRIDHDSSLRLVFSEPRAFRDFIQGFVDPDNTLRLDWTTMKQVATRHTDERFKQIENDMIWEVGALGDPGRLTFLMVEFQSQPDWTMALRMWNYFGQLHTTLAKRHDCQQRRQLPRVRPIVLYNGEPAWTPSRDFAGLVKDASADADEQGPQLPYLLVDAFRSPELDRGQLNVADALFRLQRVESMDAARDEVSWLKQWLGGQEWQSLRRALIAWIIKVLVPWRLPEASVADVGELTEWEELEAAMTTWSEQLRAEGRTEGRTEGRAEGRTEGRTEGRAEGLAEGRVKQLVSMARQRFGEAVASTMSALLGSVRTESALDEVGTWLLTCETGDALIAKVRQI